MPYKIEDLVIYPYDTFVYTVDVYRYVKDKDGTFRFELVSSKNFEIDKFLGYSKTQYSIDKKLGTKYSKSIELLAAPIKFIEENNGIRYEYQTKRRTGSKAKKKTVNLS